MGSSGVRLEGMTVEAISAFGSSISRGVGSWVSPRFAVAAPCQGTQDPGIWVMTLSFLLPFQLSEQPRLLEVTNL